MRNVIASLALLVAGGAWAQGLNPNPPGGDNCKPLKAAPPTPFAPGVSALSSTSLAVSWAKPKCATSYELYQGGSKIADPTSRSYTVTSLTAGTEYCFTVKGVNALGTSDASPQTCLYTIPATPTNLAASATAFDKVAASWDAMTGATGYKLFQNDSTTPTYMGANTTYTVENLTAETTYSYKVASYNNSGTSALSSAVSVTTPGAETILLSMPMDVSGGVISETANTVAHVTWGSNGTLSDSKSNSWSYNGTLSTDTANPFTTTRYGKYGFNTSPNNSYSLASTNALQFASTFTICAVFSPTSASQYAMIASNFAAPLGWDFYIANTGVIRGYVGNGSSVNFAETANAVAARGPNVACMGVGSGKVYAKLNGGATASETFAYSPASSSTAYLGRRADNYYFDGTIYEFYASTDGWDETWVTATQKRILGFYQGDPDTLLTVTRATAATYEQNGQLWAIPSGAPRVTSGGSLYEGSRKNELLRNTTINPTTYSTIWKTEGVTAAAPTVTANSADVTDIFGTKTATKLVFPAVASSQASTIYQEITGTAAAYSGYVWLRTATGTATVYAGFFDASSTYHTATCSVTTTWTRCGPSNKTLTAATWRWSLGIDARDAAQGTSSGATVYAIGAQAELGAFPSTLVVNAGSALTRNADAVYLSTPTLGNIWNLSVVADKWESSPWSSGTAWQLDSNTTADGNNTSRLTMGASDLVWTVTDNTPTTRTVTVSSPGYSAGSSHTFKVSSTSGALSMTCDGTNCGTASGTLNAFSANPTYLYLGAKSDATDNFFGYLKNLVIKKQ